MAAPRPNLPEHIRAALRAPSGQGGDLALTAALHDLHPADIAEALGDLSLPESLAVFNWLDNERAAAVLSDLEQETTRYVLNNAPPARVADLLDRLPMDDAAWVVSEASPDRAEVLMRSLSARAPEDADEVRELLSYDADTAGRLMTSQFVRLAASMTMPEAFAAVRASDDAVERLADLYVVDDLGAPEEQQHLVGVVSLRELIRATPEKRVEEIMTRDPLTVSVDTDQEEVARQISKYDFVAMPVLDRGGALAGIVSVDDIIDVLQEESTEDHLRFGAVSVDPDASSQPYFSTPIWRVVRSRVGWLALLFVGGAITSTVLHSFEGELSRVAALTVFIPLLIGTGGNTGAQTVATIIRGLALREIEPADALRVAARELLGGLLLGSLLGAFGFLSALLLGNTAQMGLVVGLSVLAICTWANIIGSLVPMVAQRVKIDPALVSAPLITTLVDATGLIIYFFIAKALLSALQ